jgi:hypothetical protein
VCLIETHHYALLSAYRDLGDCGIGMAALLAPVQLYVEHVAQQHLHHSTMHRPQYRALRGASVPAFKVPCDARLQLRDRLPAGRGSDRGIGLPVMYQCRVLRNLSWLLERFFRKERLD